MLFIRTCCHGKQNLGCKGHLVYSQLIMYTYLSKESKHGNSYT
jgi:hypothetical protein